ncbi:MAG TPA: hypothetical protein VIX86_27470 [Streptosporangiaceae bacterium]
MARRARRGAGQSLARGKAARAQRLARRSLRARQQSARVQLAPFASSARMTARQGVHGARRWAAPRLDRMGRGLEERVAPRMSAMLSAAARRIEPARPQRRRWPLLAAGVAVIAGGSAAAMMLRKRRKPAPATDLGWAGGPPVTPAADRGRPVPEAARVDVNGQLRTP